MSEVLVLLAIAIAMALTAGLRRRHRPPVLSRDTSVEELLSQGRRIDAIRHYRETHGVGLKEAKKAVQRIERGMS